MKNLFSIRTEKFFEHIYKIDTNDQLEIDNIYSQVLEQIPLYISDEHLAILMNSNTTIDLIADCCIDICTKYFFYPHFKNVSNGLSPWVQLYEEFSNKQIDTKLFKNEEDIFKENVKEFLLYSFLYRRSYHKEPIAIKRLDNSPFFKRNPRNTDAASFSINRFSTLLSRLNNRSQQKNTSPQKYRTFNYRSQIDTIYSPKYYLDFLINYTPTQTRISHNIFSLYDIYIFWGLITNKESNNNPYLLPNEENSSSPDSCHLDNFLSAFSKFMPSLENESINDFCTNLNQYYDLHLSKKFFLVDGLVHFLDMHSILTEKVTHINLITEIYINRTNFLEAHHLDDALYDLAGYPLLKYRIHLMDRFQALILDNNLMTNASKDLNKISSKIFCHQIFHTFPILDIVFHTLLLKYGFFKAQIKSGNTFNLMNKKNPLFAYEKNSSTGFFTMSPKLISGIPRFEKDSDKHLYSTILNNVYDTFGTMLFRGDDLPIITLKENTLDKDTSDSLIDVVKKNCYPKIQDLLIAEFNKELGSQDLLKKTIKLKMNAPFTIGTSFQK